MRPIFRFAVLVALPAIAGLLLLWWTTDEVLRAERARGLERLAHGSVELLGADLARATLALSELARPWPEAAADDPGVQRAAAGDTLRALRRREDGVGISVLLPAPDTIDASVLRGEGRLRSPVLERMPELTGASAAFYLNVAWTAGDSLSPATLPGAWLDPGSGRAVVLEGDRRGHLLAASEGATTSTAALLVLAGPAVASPIRPIARWVGGILLVLSCGMTVLGLAPGTRGAPAPRMSAAGLILLALTLVGSGGWAISQGHRAQRASVVQDLSQAGALLRAYDRLGDARASAAVTGHRVLRIPSGGEVSTSDGSPVPAGADALPTPPPAFPATGRLRSTNEHYLVMREEGGRTVLLMPPGGSSRPALMAALGGTLFGLGLLVFLRGGIAARDEEHGAVAPEGESPVSS